MENSIELEAVSYTHLDVYKRQYWYNPNMNIYKPGIILVILNALKMVFGRE